VSRDPNVSRASRQLAGMALRFGVDETMTHDELRQMLNMLTFVKSAVRDAWREAVEQAPASPVERMLGVRGAVVLATKGRVA
jgi:hypothetical protein